MVVGDKHYKHIDEGPVRSVRRNRSPPAATGDDDAASTSSSDSGMRTGADYQADIPEFTADSWSASKIDNHAILVWSPNPEAIDSKVDAYLTLARQKYSYNTEQALGMLYSHKYNVDRALSDLPNFTPFPDEWSVEDRVLFEQAFSFHGKNFHRIRLMLPDKSIGSLVKYYYTWKKTRCRCSVLDKPQRPGYAPTVKTSDDVNDDSDSDFETARASEKGEPSTSMPRGGVGPRVKGELRNKRKPPCGMYLDRDDLLVIASGPAGQGDALVKMVETELTTYRRQAQANKQAVAASKQRTTMDIESLRPPKMAPVVNPKWTNDELLLAVQGVRKYGRDFATIAEVIGNKTENHLRTFFVNHLRRYNLDQVVLEYEKEHGKQDGMEPDDGPEEMEVESTASDHSTVRNVSASPPPLLKQTPLPPPTSRVATETTATSAAPGYQTVSQQQPDYSSTTTTIIPRYGTTLNARGWSG